MKCGGVIVDEKGIIIGHSKSPDELPNPAWFPEGSKIIPLP
jgi:hypothetical protein